MDRRSSVFKDGLRRVVPGSTQNSFLYHRLISTEYGLSMPPTGPLRPEQIEIIKAWIDQGADWPDSLANDAELPAPDPKAVAAIMSLRNGDRAAFLKTIAQDPALINAPGPEGSTPFMYAAIYGDAPLLQQLLKKGAKPNLKNAAGATALMWAATNLEKTRVLIAGGAEVNVISDDLRTPLMIAAGSPSGKPIVQLLLNHGANVNPTKRPGTESSPLIQAILAANPETMQLLIAHGADIKASAGLGFTLAFLQNCTRCADLLMRHDLEKDVYTSALQSIANFADAATVKMLLDHGAAVDAPDPLGHTPLAYAAGSDLVRADVVKLLLDHGANVNSASPHKNSGDTGMSPLDLARLRGETPVVAALLKAGATSGVTVPNPPKPRGAESARTAIEHSLPLLQRADAGFTAKAGCVSCHNDSMTAMATGLARSHGISVDENIARQQLKANVSSLTKSRDLLHQGYAGGGPPTDTFVPQVLGYVLIGLNAEGYQPDLDTDAAAMYIKSRQLPDGSWPYPAADTRPPICSDYIGQTALALRALQLYSPAVFKADYERSVAMAAGWLVKSEPQSTEDFTWKTLGVAWAAKDKDAIAKSRSQLLALQRADGGWGDLPTMPSSNYATGRALVALQTAGLAVTDAAYKRGVDFLLKNQLEDGSWFVKTRALGFQPYFETGFPHGVDQSISAAGTNWATMAIALTLDPGTTKPTGTR
jgi:ankyrin repeat protein